MPQVRIVCDSTADLQPQFQAAHNIHVVPLKVLFGDDVFEDGVTIHTGDFYARMKTSAAHPRTSQPTPGEFEAAFQQVGSDGRPIVCTTISAELSGTYASAAQAKAALPDLDIRLIDTRSVAVGHTAAVHAAVRAAEAGQDAAAVEAAVREVMARQRILFTVETLEYLRRGGRIGGARALLGSMLDIKPILAIVDGAIEPVDRVRTFQRALDHILATVAAAAAEWGGASVLLAHGDRPEAAAALVERIQGVAGIAATELAEVGPVIGCHAGPGVIGVQFQPLASNGAAS